MTSVALPAHSRSTKVNIAAQDLVKLREATKKHGLLRKKGSKLKIGKWPYRFVVLGHDSIFIFNNETSKVAHAKFSLLGYNRVARTDCKPYNWCFSVMPAKDLDTVKPKVFACTTDHERKAWMMAIRKQIYTANNISKPVSSPAVEMIKNISGSDSAFEEDYSTVEEPVYEAGDIDIKTLTKDSDSEDDDDDSFDSSSGESIAPVMKRKRSHSLPHSSLTYDDASSSSQTLLNIKRHGSIASSTSAQEDVSAALANLRLQQNTSKNVDLSLSVPDQVPPRYSEVLRDGMQPEHDYANLRSIAQLPVPEEEYDRPPPLPEPSLEILATVKDIHPDRDHLICLLQAKKEPGTYLVRKSRNSDSKVISYLYPNGHVKEYKILGEKGAWYIDQNKTFETIEKLLRFYTYEECIPNTEFYLKHPYKKVHTHSI